MKLLFYFSNFAQRLILIIFRTILYCHNFLLQSKQIQDRSSFDKRRESINFKIMCDESHDRQIE